MHYVGITTGSCGNCYVFHSCHDTIIIDDGVTFRKITEKMADHGIPLESIRALFLTHLHPDHSKGVGVLQRKLGIPVYMSREAMERNGSVMMKQKIEINRVNAYDFGDTIDVPGFSVTPFPVSHDSDGAAGYAFQSDGVRCFLMTDTGIIPEEAWQLASRASVKFIESNYDDEMLRNGPYPEFLKARIYGSRGHLSNREAVSFARQTSRQGDSIYFVHLSANNNAPELVKELAVKEIPSGIFCHVCSRGELFEGFADGEE